MKYIHNYNIFESVKKNQFFKTYEETKNWLDKMDIENYSINNDLIVDVDNDIDLRSHTMKGRYGEIMPPLEFIPINFGEVTGSFNCQNNKLKNLKGIPKIVGDDFNCSYNLLKSLEGCPNEVKGNFYCNNNYLKSLEDVNLIEGSFDFTHNKIFDVSKFPKRIDENIYYYGNPIEKLFDCMKDPESVFNIIEYLNEYKVITTNSGSPSIYLERLKEALYMVDEEDTFDYDKLKSKKTKYYNIIEE